MSERTILVTVCAVMSLTLLAWASPGVFVAVCVTVAVCVGGYKLWVSR